MRCGVCKPHYRCTFLSQYAAKNKVSHPTSVYLHEEQLLPEIDAWLSRKFDAVAFTSAVREFEAAHPGGRSAASYEYAYALVRAHGAGRAAVR